MASKKPKTQAERVASSVKTKPSAGKGNATAKKGSSSVAEQKTMPERTVPARLISSVVFLSLFVLFLVIFFAPEGAILTLIAEIFRGLFGKAAFMFAIPSCLYLFLIHAFSGKRPVLMRTICVCSFVR